MKKERILVVDDEAMVREMVRDMLEAEGYRTIAVDSGRSALQVAREEAIDLLLADIRMPEMNGLQLVEELRHEVPEVVSILITGYASVATARQAIQQGVYDYIVKPFDRAELTTSVEGALARKRLADENARLKSLVGLLQVGQAVAASSEYPQTLEVIVRTAMEQTASVGGSVMLFDLNTGGVTMAAVLGSWVYAAHVADAILKNGVAHLRFEIGGGIFFTDREQHPLFELVQHRSLDSELRASRLKGGEILLLPIETDKETTGIFAVCREAGKALLSEGGLELLRILAAEASVAVKSHQSLSRMEGNCLACLRSIASRVEEKSPHTKGHMERVAQLSRQLARKAGLDGNEVEVTALAASLHDLGKLGVSETVLSKPEGPSAEEQNTLRQHPAIADEILACLPFLSRARDIIRHHHEQFDGAGYPDGLAGEEITPATHVVILSNIYDNLVSGDVMTPAVSREDAILRLQEGKGTRFDPDITDIFVGMLKAGDIRK